ncbi:MAG: hypothetical protein JXR78_12660 [Victivallales bacterium]|nr:hypothetical protein [Victivallales bacterium]
MTVPRNEYPRPQFKRDRWMCLNGEWQFEIDNGDSGLQRGFLEQELKNRIMVPFCPESKLSGIGCKDFMEAVWYRRHINIPGDWREKILLHFQACDYDTTVWVNGHELGSHRGGFTPFCFEISKFIIPGDNVEIVVRARDYSRMHKAAGKQSLNKYNNQGCFYDRTTGIWQTVWLEPVPQCSFNRPRITPDPTGCCFNIQTPLRGIKNKGMHIKAKIFAKDKLISSASICADLQMTPELTLNIPETDMILWEPGAAFLYDVELELLDAGGNVVDRVSSYAGMRSVSLCGKDFLINGKRIFQRQVLDQGYYHDGIMTAPDEETLIKDIELSLAAGFNSARLHQKVFEERFLYHPKFRISATMFC